MAKTKDIAGARNCIWRLLKFRQRSEYEIRQRLAQGAYEPSVSEEAIRYFKDNGYLDDRLFAKQWIDARLDKPLGLRAIRVELQRKGVSPEIIDELLTQKKQTIDERAIVEKVAEKYFAAVKEKKELSPRLKPRFYGYLLRRGFSPEVISEVVQKFFKE